MPRISFALAAAFVAIASSASAATVYTVNSGATQVDTIVTPFTTAETGVAFYNYAGSEANPAFDLSGNTLHVYLHQQTGTDDVSLGYIFNTNDNGEATSGGSFSGTITGALASATGGIADDGSENFGWKASDAVDGAATVNGNFGLNWLADYTDGFTINTDADEAWSINLNASVLTGISNFVFLYGDPNQPQSLFLENPANTTLTVSALQLPNVSAVPLPPAMLLLGGAVFGLGAFGRRRA